MLGRAFEDPRAWDGLFSPPIAHRGLWLASGAPENSLAAFEAACDGGYGIELDVQLSADGEAMVFHDAHLARMAGAASALVEKTAQELAELRLKSSRESIPTLGQVFDLVGGRSLILIEIKSRPGEEGPLDQRVAELIEDYRHPLAVIGFNPYSHAWWRDHRPTVLRGLNTHARDDALANEAKPDAQSIERALRGLEIAAPHFLAPGLEMTSSPAVAKLRGEGYPVVAWTVRSLDQSQAFAAYCDNMIFEGFAL